jgi:hypothetical protein
VTDRSWVDANDLQRPPFGLNKRMAYAVLSAVGVRVTPRRLIASRARVERFIAGEEVRPLAETAVRSD